MEKQGGGGYMSVTIGFHSSEVKGPKYKKVWTDFKKFEEIELNILLYCHKMIQWATK